MNSQSDAMDERYSMTKLENRLRTFQDGVVLQKKKLRWSFKVIPYQAMAKLGFYFDPVIDPKTSKLNKDCVRCCYCHRRTYNVRDCRSRKKDVLETLSNITRRHLTDSDNKQVCLLIYLRNKLLKDYSFHMGVSDWKNDKHFSEPDSKIMLNFRRFTFKDDWPHGISHNEHQLNIENMVNAGLIRYDTSIEGLKDPNMDKALMSDSCYCIYCKHSLQGWSSHDDPLRRHYDISQKGNCYFFQIRNRFERMRNDKDSTISSSDTISQSCGATTTQVEEERDDVVAVKTTSQSQNSLVSPSSPGKNLQNNGDNGLNSLVIQHDRSVLSELNDEYSKQNKIKEKQQIHLENGNTTLRADNTNQGVSAVENGISLTPIVKESKRSNSQLAQFSSPTRKRRKFKRISPRRIFDEEDSENSFDNSTVGLENKDKDLVIDFTSHINKARDTGRKNAILDDSTDEFSFSNQGHSTFDIPVPTSSHLLRDIGSDIKIVTQDPENPINASSNSKEAVMKEEKYLASDDRNEDSNDTRLVGRDFNTTTPGKSGSIDQRSNDTNANKGLSNETRGSSVPHELYQDKITEVRTESEEGQKNDVNLPIRRLSDASYSDILNSNSNNITDNIPKGEIDGSNLQTFDASLHKKALGDAGAKERSTKLDSLPPKEPVIPAHRKLDNIDIDLHLSVSDFSSSSHSEQSSKSSSAISTPVASPKINVTRSLHAVKELSGLARKQFNDLEFANKQDTTKMLEYVSVKNETTGEESPIFETGTPIAYEEHKSKKLFENEFLGKELETPIYLSTVDLNKSPKPEPGSILPVVGNSISSTSLHPQYSPLEKQKKEKTLTTDTECATGCLLNEETKNSRADFGEWCKIDENRLLVKNYFHDLLKYINNNDATLSNDKDGDLAFLIKQMPNEELDMTFTNWVNLKVRSIKHEFIDDCEKKLNILRNDFDTAKNYVETLEDDDELIEIAKKMGVL
ncbi:survivin [Saccharomyces eubayanus]|uniref:survivin n=1 Tax=Saccharomyces eubayanus TaxID=1080349 RepID=UPI0006C5D3EF|nr:BIR1-like protein [Saccharomyces eubayanus]KOG98669.1 BIR1-like protein [Saccharomyces eubayanus]